MKRIALLGGIVILLVAGCSDPNFIWPTAADMNRGVEHAITTGTKLSENEIEVFGNMLAAQTPDRAAEIMTAKDTGMVIAGQIGAEAAKVAQTLATGPDWTVAGTAGGALLLALLTGANQVWGTGREEKRDNKQRRVAERQRRMDAVDVLAGNLGQSGAIPPWLAQFIQQVTPAQPVVAQPAAPAQPVQPVAVQPAQPAPVAPAQPAQPPSA